MIVVEVECLGTGKVAARRARGSEAAPRHKARPADGASSAVPRRGFAAALADAPNPADIPHRAPYRSANSRGGMMSPFELVFAAYGLLLGLAFAEVLGGFARTLKLKRAAKPVRVGWLTPLLGLVVMLDLTSFWGLAYDAREQIGANYPTLIGVLAMVGVYYLAASLIFPEVPEEWPDFDEWYDKQNRMVIGGLLAANVASWIGGMVLDAVHPLPEVAEVAGNEGVTLVYLFSGLGVLALLLALLFVKGRRLNVAMLAALAGLLMVAGCLEAWV